MNTLATRVKGQVVFSHYQDQALWYKTEDGWAFPVPISDTETGDGGSARFNSVDKGIFFMRWIRKAMTQEAKYQAEAKTEP
jgi:hypothetical protein